MSEKFYTTVEFRKELAKRGHHYSRPTIFMWVKDGRLKSKDDSSPLSKNAKYLIPESELKKFTRKT